jgi:hypothetical protein
LALLAAASILLVAPAAQGAAPPAEATEASRREAAERFDRALTLYHEGNFAAALVELRVAYELVPSYKVLYDIAQVEFELKDYAGALTAFQMYLAEGGSQVPADRRAAVEKHVAELVTRVSNVTIVTSVPGVTLAVDDAPISRSPLPGPVLLSAGRHTVTGSKEGYAPVTVRVDVAGAHDTRVTLDLMATGPGAPAAPTPIAAQVTPLPSSAPAPETPPAPFSIPRLAWIGAGTAGALAIGAVATGSVALAKSNDLTRSPPPTATAQSQRDTVKTYATVTDVLWVTAAVTLGATVVYTLVYAKSPQRPGLASHATCGVGCLTF